MYFKSFHVISSKLLNEFNVLPKEFVKFVCHSLVTDVLLFKCVDHVKHTISINVLVLVVHNYSLQR